MKTKKRQPTSGPQKNRVSSFGRALGQGSGRARAEQIDLGLTLLHRLCLPGQALTRGDIAAWAGCSESAIYLIELRALKKLRKQVQSLT